MSTRRKRKFSCKIWIEYQGKPVIGKGGAQILEQIRRDSSISKAAKRLGMSYRYVWNYLRKVERTLGEPVIETFRGGKLGGGGARLTELGGDLLEEYMLFEQRLVKALSELEH